MSENIKHNEQTEPRELSLEEMDVIAGGGDEPIRRQEQNDKTNPVADV